jgi:hypothetical protein
VEKRGERAAASIINGQGRDTKEPAQSQKPSNSGRDRQAQEHRTHREMNVIRTGGERERGCAIPVLPSTQPETGARAHPRSTSSPFLIIPSPPIIITVRLLVPVSSFATRVQPDQPEHPDQPAIVRTCGVCTLLFRYPLPFQQVLVDRIHGCQTWYGTT